MTSNIQYMKKVYKYSNSVYEEHIHTYPIPYTLMLVRSVMYSVCSEVTNFTYALCSIHCLFLPSNFNTRKGHINTSIVNIHTYPIPYTVVLARNLMYSTCSKVTNFSPCYIYQIFITLYFFPQRWTSDVSVHGRYERY